MMAKTGALAATMCNRERNDYNSDDDNGREVERAREAWQTLVGPWAV